MSERAKWTPGPWEIVGWVTSKFPTPHNVYTLIRGRGRRVASVTVYGRRDDGEVGGRKRKNGDSVPTVAEAEAKANARLIALAPEMVEALREIMPVLQGWHRDDPRTARVRAILAKLEDES